MAQCSKFWAGRVARSAGEAGETGASRWRQRHAGECLSGGGGCGGDGGFVWMDMAMTITIFFFENITDKEGNL